MSGMETDKLSNKLDIINSNILKLTESVGSMQKTSKQLFEDNNVCKKNHEDTNERINNLENQIKNLENKLNFFYTRENRNKIVIFKIPDTSKINEDIYSCVLSILKKISPDIERSNLALVHRLGNMQNKRPVLVKFDSIKWKHVLFKNKHLWKNVNIYCSYYLTMKEVKKKRELMRIVSILQSRGYQIQMRGMRIYLAGKLISEEEATKLTKEDVTFDDEDEVQIIEPPYYQSEIIINPLHTSQFQYENDQKHIKRPFYDSEFPAPIFIKKLRE